MLHFRYRLSMLFVLLGCQKMEEIQEEPCIAEPELLSEEVSMNGQETTTTYNICSSDVPENWLISVTDLVEQINQFSHCSWVASDRHLTGEPFEISIDIERYSIMKLIKIEGLSSTFEYSSIVIIPGTIQFSQDGEMYNSDIGFWVEVDAFHEDGWENFYVDLKNFAKPYEDPESEPFLSWIGLYSSSDGIPWRAFKDEKLKGVEIFAEGIEYEHSRAVCQKID